MFHFLEILWNTYILPCLLENRFSQHLWPRLAYKINLNFSRFIFPIILAKGNSGSIFFCEQNCNTEKETEECALLSPPISIWVLIIKMDKLKKESAQESTFSAVGDKLGLHRNVSSMGFFSAFLGCCIPSAWKMPVTQKMLSKYLLNICDFESDRLVSSAFTVWVNWMVEPRFPPVSVGDPPHSTAVSIKREQVSNVWHGAENRVRTQYVVVVIGSVYSMNRSWSMLSPQTREGSTHHGWISMLC